MAKKKKSMGNIIFMFVALVFTILSFVGLALNFMTKKWVLASFTNSETWKLNDAFSVMSDYKELDYSGADTVLNSKVVMIIALVVLCLAVLVVLVNYFAKNKWLGLLSIVLGLAAIVCFVVFLIMMLSGLSTLSDSFITETTISANVGVYFVAIFGIMASACTMVKVK